MTLAQSALPARVLEHLSALEGLEFPLAYVDVEAFELNAGALLAEAGPTLPIRIASKSLRCTALIDYALQLSDRFQGVMGFTVPEALHLARQGINDILIAYPSANATALRELAAFLAEHPEHVVRPMVDSTAHATLIATAATEAGIEIPVCIDVDTAWQPVGARGPAIGSKRSPLRTPEQVVGLVRELSAIDGIRVDALMAYDGQIAGVGDEPPGRKLYGRAIRFMQGRSLAELKHRVPRIVAAVRAELERHGGSLELVNVGGTGSLSRANGIEGATELASGSGLYVPTLFDAYSRLFLTPAAFFVLPVVRRPGPEVATVLGGGYIASGAVGKDRWPTPVWPLDLAFDPNEGAGEVQTPLLGEQAEMLELGDPVVFRHAKAGELCERFDRLHLIRAGRVIDTVPTYRGEGHTFL